MDIDKSKLAELGVPDAELKKAARAEQRIKRAERMMADIKSSSAKPAVPALGEMIERVLDKFGGPEAFAEAYHDVYMSAPVGSATKARLIEKFLDLMKSYNQINPENEGADLSMLVDGELDQIIKEVLK